MAMHHTAELDMGDTINKNDIADFLINAAWVFCSNYHTVLKTLPGVAIFGCDMLFDIPFLSDWSKIGEYRQKNKWTRILSEKRIAVAIKTGIISPVVKYL